MKKIGFFIKNKDLANVDYSCPEKGNPGMGGREYMNSIISYSLSFFMKDTLSIKCYLQVDTEMPESQSTEVVDNLEQAIEFASKDKIDFFVLDVSQSYQNVFNFVEAAETYQVNIVVRLGLLPNYKILNLLSSSQFVKTIVCNERQVYEIIKDHKASSKSIIIRNPIVLDSYSSDPIKVSKNIVTYMGSLVPQKGFLRLAKIWLSVVEEVPDAELYVLGSATLYSRNEELGQLGIALEPFEQMIKTYLANDKGEIHSSVKFLGTLGNVKNYYLANSVVGIANPTGETETFCLAAAEIQANYTAVIAGRVGGLLDTVSDNESGYLINNDQQLKEKIIYLLNNKDLSYEMGLAGRKYIEDRYHFKNIAERWSRLFEKLPKNLNELQDVYFKDGRDIISKFSTFNIFLKKNIFFNNNLWPSTMHFHFWFLKLVRLRRKCIKFFIRN